VVKNLLKLIVISGIIVTGFFVVSSPAYAVDCARDMSGNFTMTSDCTFAGVPVDGVDTGAGSSNTAILVLQSGILLVNSNQTISFGSLSLTGGSLALSGTLEVGLPLWVIDADGDGYPATTEQYAQTSAPTDGIRRNLVTSLTADCDDSTYSETNECCNVITWYQDSDIDTYGNPSVSTEACDDDPPTGYVTNNSDCYDSSANAKPGQTTCFTTNRGDGSFDYNCDDSQSACNSCSTSSSSNTYYYRQCDAGYCWTDPYNQTFTGYTCSGSTSTCGAGGTTCTGGKYSGCVYNPCSLYDEKATGTSGCTVSCR